MGTGKIDREWLVADHRGAFAMGTPAGIRTRKYHGFFMGVPGRSEMAFLSDLEIRLDGEDLWPHAYAGGHDPTGKQVPVLHPDPDRAGVEFKAHPSPTWSWKRPKGTLVFQVDSPRPGVIRLSWEWSGKAALLEMRPFFAMRRLHWEGGQAWKWQGTSTSGVSVIEGPEGEEVFLRIDGAFSWEDSPSWYRSFYYTEEAERGYCPTEDLFSAGIIRAKLDRAEPRLVWRTSLEPKLLEERDPPKARPVSLPAVTDFVLLDPPGVVAGFPWFGEWGRDTFVSLPGIVAGWLSSKMAATTDEVWGWAFGVLARWGKMLAESGRMPNLIDYGGTHQWDSADATLWWSHALAGLWQLGLGTEQAKLLAREFGPGLDRMILEIEAGRNPFLRLDGRGLLEVTQGHTTWMDARVDGQAVTPRTGALPEINALWFQAQCLRAVWSGKSIAPFRGLAKAALEVKEPNRPNRVFLHSVPLAPSFVFRDLVALKDDLAELDRAFWTPVGLRSLAPEDPEYHARCAGTQRERDLAYHRGPVWGWLAGHYEMARQRSGARAKDETLSPPWLASMPIEHHIPEIFDAEAPFLARGAPAQAWSLACIEEAFARKRLGLDTRLKSIMESYEDRATG